MSLALSYCCRRVAPVLIAFVGIAYGQAPSSSASLISQHSQQLREMNQQVLNIYAQLQASLSKPNVLHQELKVLSAARSALLATLVREDSREALSLALSPEVLTELIAAFPEAATNFESHGHWEGRIERWVIDNQDKSHRALTLLKSGSQIFELSFSHEEPAGLANGSTLQVEGAQVGNTIAVSWAASTTNGAASTSLTNTASGSTLSTGCCSTTGAQNIAVFLITFPGVPVPSYLTSQSVYASYFGTNARSLDGYWREASYGKTWATGSVYGVYTLSTSYGCTTTNDFDAMRSETLTQAANAGVNLSGYTAFAFVAPDYQCGWAGLASIGPMTLNNVTGGFSYINGTVWRNSNDDPVKTLAHEAGHNLGLNHSNSRAFGTEALGPVGSAGTLTEYGDQFSAMADGAFGHYAAPHKAEILNWLPNYQVVQSSGTFTIQPLEITSTGLQALKIQRGTGNNSWLWVEYRQPLGNYDNSYINNYPQWYPWANQIFTGALIHYEDSLTTGGYSHLLDFTPTSSSAFLDPVLAAGQTWSDPYSNLTIAVGSATSSGLTVAISYGAASCTHANPTISASPLNPSTSAGGTVNYTLSVTSNDSPACSGSTFGLISSQPSTWPTSFSTSGLALLPGQTGSVNMTKTAPSGTLPGTYAVDATAVNGSFSGTSAANVTVMNGATLSVGLSVSTSSYSVRQTVTMTAAAMNGALAASGVTVTFTLTQPGGLKTSKVVTADSSGKAVWSYKIGAKGPTGIYTVTAQATYNSHSATSSPVSFTVN